MCFFSLKLHFYYLKYGMLLATHVLNHFGAVANIVLGKAMTILI